MNLIEKIREQQMEKILSLKSVKKGWVLREKFLTTKMDDFTKKKMISLSDYLGECFRITAPAPTPTSSSIIPTSSRAVSNILNSGSGDIWESIVTWYLNICLYGTNAVAVRGGEFCPKPIKDSISILHDSSVLHSEPDVMIISSKELNDLEEDKSWAKSLKKINEVVEKEFKKVCVINIQVKTNWNENAQYGMLWNMLYKQARDKHFAPNGFRIGINTFTISNLAHFGFAWMTVPTNKTVYTPSRLEVLRVKGLMSKNYWGKPTKANVAFSLSGIFDEFTRSPYYPNVNTVGELASEILGGKKTDLVFKRIFGLK